MPLIKSISGIRGTIGGGQGDNLTPIEISKFTAAYGSFIIQQSSAKKRNKIIIGRDSRISGEMVKNLVVGILLSQGLDVIDLGMSPTPTVEMAVKSQEAQGGIIITASHNPTGWNALKLLNEHGEFLSADEGEIILGLAEKGLFNYVPENEIGTYTFNPYLEWDHIHKILSLPSIDKELIKSKNFKIVVDGINSIGGKAVPHLLEALGLKNLVLINCSPDGKFAHNPEPLKENLLEVMKAVKDNQADLGIVVDPDVDRLAFIDENGEMFGEEYTLVSIADYLLSKYDEANLLYRDKYSKSAVSNLSSSRALSDVAQRYGGTYYSAAVGEVNVVKTMKEKRALIGGEGNGGVIFPELHYGRDALVGIALFLTALSKSGKKVSELKKNLPDYYMVKDKMELEIGTPLLSIFDNIKSEYINERITDIDGVKIDWEDSWVHLRASNTEPIMRIYAEANSPELASSRVKDIKEKILTYIRVK